MRALLLLALLLGGCRVETKVLQRANNGGGVDAILAERLTDATAATPLEVYLVPKGEPVSGQAVFRADHTEALSVRWDGSSQLVVIGKKARVFLSEASRAVGGGTVAVRLEIVNVTKP